MEEAWSDAIKEAYASAPVNVIILATLELRHSSWTTPVRVVCDKIDLLGLIEDGAPADENKTVTFSACAFEALTPESSDKLPEIQIRIDNVSREISGHVDSAMGQRAPIEITYREYLNTDAETYGPHYVLNGLTLRRVTCTDMSVTGTATFGDYINRAFPRPLFTAQRFPGLVRS